MKFLLKLKSVSDVITNSSSEVFMVKTKNPHKSLKQNILNFHDSVEWYGTSYIDDIPQGLKWLLTDDLVDAIRENSDGSSGMGGSCEVYGWEDGLEEYQKWTDDESATLEDFARYLKKSVDELMSFVIVDIDWACRGTINMLKDKHNVMQGDACYDDDEFNFYYKAFKYGLRND